MCHSVVTVWCVLRGVLYNFGLIGGWLCSFKMLPPSSGLELAGGSWTVATETWVCCTNSVDDACFCRTVSQVIALSGFSVQVTGSQAAPKVEDFYTKKQGTPLHFQEPISDKYFPSPCRSSQSSVSFSLPHPNPLCIFLSSQRATCSAHPVLPYLITQIMFDEAYKSWSSSLCICHQSPLTTSPLCQNTFLSTLYYNTTSFSVSLIWETKLLIHITQ